MGYILYSKKINASHICPPNRNKWFKPRKLKLMFSGNIDFDLEITNQSAFFDENMK